MKHYSEIIKKVIADSNEKCDPDANQPKPDEKNNSQANNQEITSSKSRFDFKRLVYGIFRFAKTSCNTVYRSIRHINLKK